MALSKMTVIAMYTQETMAKMSPNKSSEHGEFGEYGYANRPAPRHAMNKDSGILCHVIQSILLVHIDI
jgi:hypothetical protein